MFLLLNIKKRFLPIVIILSFLLTMLSGCQKAPKDAVATVNGEIISKTDFDSNFDMYKKVYEEQYGADIMKKDAGNDKTFEEVIKEKILENLIAEKVVLQDASKQKIAVTDEEVKNQIDSYKELLGGAEKFQEFLKKNNMTEKYFTEGMKKNMIIQKYSEDYMKKLKITDEEAQKYFDENKDKFVKIRASHILVKEEEEAKNIVKRIKAGEDFHSLASTESIDTNSAVQGGDLGYFGKGQMVTEFEKTAFSLKPGEMSDPVKSQFGYHIILVEDKLDKFEDVKDDVIFSLKNSKFDEHVKKLREKADVKTYIEISSK